MDTALYIKLNKHFSWKKKRKRVKQTFKTRLLGPLITMYYAPFILKGDHLKNYETLVSFPFFFYFLFFYSFFNYWGLPILWRQYTECSCIDKVPLICPKEKWLGFCDPSVIGHHGIALHIFCIYDLFTWPFTQCKIFFIDLTKTWAHSLFFQMCRIITMFNPSSILKVGWSKL